jgi:hypothetical protein
MIYQCYFHPSQRERLFPGPPYRPFGLEPEVNVEITKNCPELEKAEHRLHLNEFRAMLHLWRNPPDDADDWIGFTSYRQLEKSPKIFSPGEIEDQLQHYDVVTWYWWRFTESLAAQAERFHRGLMPFLERMFATLNLGDGGFYRSHSAAIFASYWAMRKSDFARYMEWLYPAIDYCLRHLHSDPYLRCHPRHSAYALERLITLWCAQNGKRVSDVTFRHLNYIGISGQYSF